MKKIRILIAGGTGFIGYHLAKRCLKLKWKVVSISTKPPKQKRKLKNVSYLIIDISNQKKLVKKLSAYYDYVVNLAGYVDHSNKKKTYISHYIGCKNLATIFLNKKIIKFIQIGSCIENGKSRSPQKEIMIRNENLINSTYGLAKYKASKYLLNLYKNFSFPVVILRPYLVYGPNQNLNRFL